MTKTLRIAAMIMALALVSGLVTSCTNYNYNETEDLQFVSGMSIDRTSDGKVLITVELESATGGQEMSVNAVYLTGTGSDIVDASQNILTHTDKTIFWNHMDLVIVSQEIAQKYMSEVTDMMMRLPAIRLSLYLAVSKMPTAKEVLTLERDPHGTQLNSDIITKSIGNQNRLGKVPDVKLYQFLDSSVDEGESAILPSLSICSNNDQKKLDIAGSAVFNQVWLAGYLDDVETRTMLIVTNKQKATVLPLPPDPDGSYSNAAVEVMPNKVAIKPSLVDGKPEVSIEIDSDIVLDNLNGASNDSTQFKAVTDAIIRNAAMTLESQVYALIDKTKEMNSADVLGIGSKLQDLQPQEWKKINSKWRDLYKDLKVSVSANLKMRSTNLIKEPLRKGD